MECKKSPCRLTYLFTWKQSNTAVTALSAFPMPRAWTPWSHHHASKYIHPGMTSKNKSEKNNTDLINAIMQLFSRIVIFPWRRIFYTRALKDIKYLFVSTWREQPLILLSLARWEIERKSFGRIWHIIFFHSCFSAAQMKEICHNESAILQKERERDKEREKKRESF